MRSLVAAALLAFIGAGVVFILERGDGRTPLVATASAAPARGLDVQANPAADSESESLFAWLGRDERTEPADAELPGQPGAKVYFQFVDDSGGVHFVSSLEEVPPRWRDVAGRVEIAPGQAAPAVPAPRATQKATRVATTAVNEPVVTVYTTTWCGWCRKTVAFLDARGIEYTNKDIDANGRNREELIRKTGGTAIPVVEIDGQIVRGYNPDRMDQLL